METTADHVVIVVPDGPQIRVIREEPRNDMSGRINNLINAYLSTHIGFLTSVFSLQGPIGAEIWGSVLLLSGAVSVLIILLLLHIYFQQFDHLTSGGRGEPGLLNSLVQNSRSSYHVQSTCQRRWTKKVQEEWAILEKNLPDTIYVRVYEDRMDLLRAVIIGAAGTPYQDGLFFFDIHLPTEYPHSPPHFESFVRDHFYQWGHYILGACNAYMMGAQVGCLSGEAMMGVHGRADTQSTSSIGFKIMLAKLIPKLVLAFKEVGADCEEFVNASEHFGHVEKATI